MPLRMGEAAAAAAGWMGVAAVDVVAPPAPVLEDVLWV
jgi:hypothetical protein